MNSPAPRAVLDTVVLLQALISARGPAARCVNRLRADGFTHLMSEATSDELSRIFHRPKIRAKYPHVPDSEADGLIAEIMGFSEFVIDPPRVFRVPRDPNDEPFIDLAVAGGAQFIVTWNERRLNYLMNRDTPEGKEFCTRFPSMKIVNPVEFLAALDAFAAP